MKYEDAKAYCEAIETLNKEYKKLLCSPVLERDRKRRKIIDYLKHLKIISLFKMIMLRSRLSFIYEMYPEKENGIYGFLQEYYDNSSLKSSRIAVYYCIVGNYDNFQEPLFRPHNIDYYLFTDRPISSDIIIVKSIPEKLRDLSPSDINRYIKMHPKEFFDGYDYSIYLDGNVRVISDIRQWLVPASEAASGIAMHLHPSRDCLFDEAEVCMQIGKGNKVKILKQIEEYESAGMPKHFGLFEATAIVVNLASEEAVQLLNEWYIEYRNNESGRDQLALPYIIWKKGLPFNCIGILGSNIKDSKLLHISTKHSAN